MPKKANFTFEVHIRISEAFTLDSICREPRSFKPKDVQSACQNNELVVKSGDPPPVVINFANYVMTDFFAMAHATGLYNRQRALWEALSKVNAIAVNQLTSGMIKKREINIFDFSFLDYKGKPLILANLICEIPEKQTGLSLVKSFIGRATGKPTVTGALVCFATELDEQVVQFVQKQTATEDPIARYESMMPGLNRPFDLFRMEEQSLAPSEVDAPEVRSVVHLIHPDIKTKKVPVAPPTRTYKKKPVSDLPPYRDVKPHKEESEQAS